MVLYHSVNVHDADSLHIFRPARPILLALFRLVSAGGVRALSVASLDNGGSLKKVTDFIQHHRDRTRVGSAVAPDIWGRRRR